MSSTAATAWRWIGGGAVGRATPPLLEHELPGADIRSSPLIEAPEVVRMLRECGLTDATIARVIGTSRAKLGAWERSAARPSGLERLQDLGRILLWFRKAFPAPRDVGRWLCTPNRHLAGRRPLELLAATREPW